MEEIRVNVAPKVKLVVEDKVYRLRGMNVGAMEKMQKRQKELKEMEASGEIDLGILFETYDIIIACDVDDHIDRDVLRQLPIADFNRLIKALVSSSKKNP